jgi:hypothetical protein
MIPLAEFQWVVLRDSLAVRLASASAVALDVREPRVA